jgi:hypothetical protein
MLKNIIEEVSDYIAIQLDELLAVGNKLGRNSIGASGY